MRAKSHQWRRGGAPYKMAPSLQHDLTCPVHMRSQQQGRGHTSRGSPIQPRGCPVFWGCLSGQLLETPKSAMTAVHKLPDTSLHLALLCSFPSQGLILKTLTHSRKDQPHYIVRCKGNWLKGCHGVSCSLWGTRAQSAPDCLMKAPPRGEWLLRVAD